MAVVLPAMLPRNHVYIMIDVGPPYMQLLLYSGTIDPSDFARHVCTLVEGGMSTLPGATGRCFVWTGFRIILLRAAGTNGYTCDGCGVRLQRMRMCGNCRFARYCSRRCQRNCWYDHHRCVCPSICAAYDRTRRSNRRNYYGHISAYEFYKWYHVMDNWRPF